MRKSPFARWDLLLYGGWALFFGSAIGIGLLSGSYGADRVAELPLTWILAGFALLGAAFGITGGYRGVWQEITGARSGGGTFIFWILMVLAGGAILRGLLRFLGT